MWNMLAIGCINVTGNETTQATDIWTNRLRNLKDYTTFMEEFAAIVPRKQLAAMYGQATREMYSWLMIDMLAKSPQSMFYWNHDTRLLPVLDEEE